MQTTSDIYKELLAKGASKEVRVEVDGQIYGEDSIVGLSTTASLFVNDFLSAGGAVSRQIDLVLTNYGNISKMAKIIPSYRLVYGDQSSEWIQKGVFYIDTRVPDKASGTLTIHGFDAMLKGSVLWEPSLDLVFPMTFRAAAQAVAGLMGVELDNPEDINDTYQILDYPANNYTQRNILQFIAAAHGANFIMTDLGKLRMVGINDIPVETSTLVDEHGNSILIGGVRISVGSSTENNLTGEGSKVFVGGMVASTGAPPAFDPITRVIVKVNEENAYSSGDDTGRTLEVTCPYGTQDMAENILAKVKGYVYQPFTAEDALVDQAIELGDGITVDGVYTILAKQDILFDSLMAGIVAAPGQEEIESEYPYQTKERQVDLRLTHAFSLISKNDSEIRLLIDDEINGLSSSFTVELDSVKADITGLHGAFSSMELDLDGLTTRVQDAEGNLAELELTTQEFGVSIEGLENDFTELRLDLDGLTVTDDEGTTRVKGSGVETDSLYVKAANITGTLTANQIDATNLKVAAANITGTITATAISVKDAYGNNLLNAGGNAVKIATWNVDNNSLYSGATFDTSDVYLCTGSVGYTSIGGSPALQNWVFKAGAKFGVQKDGTAYMSNAIVQGAVTANSGKIGPWTVGDVTLYNTVGSVMYSGKALYATDTTVNYTVYLTPGYLYLLYGDARTPMAARWSKIITMAGDEA